MPIIVERRGRMMRPMGPVIVERRPPIGMEIASAAMVAGAIHRKREQQAIQQAEMANIRQQERYQEQQIAYQQQVIEQQRLAIASANAANAANTAAYPGISPTSTGVVPGMPPAYSAVPPVQKEIVVVQPPPPIPPAPVEVQRVPASGCCVVM